MIAVAATIAAATAVGVWAEQRWGRRAQTASRRLLVGALYTLSPFVTFFNVARLHVDADVAGGLGLGIVMLLLVGGLAWLVATRVLHLARAKQGALIASVMQANTGYVGLPFVLVLLGASHLGAGAAYDALVTNPVLFLGVFGVGAAFGDRAGESVGERLRAFVLRKRKVDPTVVEGVLHELLQTPLAGPTELGPRVQARLGRNSHAGAQTFEAVLTSTA